MTFGERGAMYTWGEKSAEPAESLWAREPFMGGLTSFFVTMGVGVGVLFAFFLIYYIGSIANTIYELKVELRREMDGRIEDIRRHVERELSKRGDWMRSESEDAGSRLKEEIAAENFEYRKQVQTTLAEIAKELRSLQALGALRGQGVVPGDGQGVPAKAKDGTDAATGEKPAGAPDEGPVGASPAGKMA